MTMSVLRAGVVAALVLVGSFFLLVGTVGLLRLPDVYNRMHATSKATTLGASSIFLAGFVFFLPGGAALISLVGIVFLFLTAPTGAHLISRSAQKMGVPLALGATWPEEAPGGEVDVDVGGEGDGDADDVGDEDNGEGDDGGGDDESDDEYGDDESDDGAGGGESGIESR